MKRQTRTTAMILCSALAVILVPALFGTVEGSPAIDFAQSTESSALDSTCIRQVISGMNLPLGYSVERVETIDHGNGNTMIAVTVCPGQFSRAPCLTIFDSVDASNKSTTCN